MHRASHLCFSRRGRLWWRRWGSYGGGGYGYPYAYGYGYAPY
jgi:hypothetical protein